MLENNHYAVTVNHDRNETTTTFKFKTADGGELIAVGAVAKNVCDFLNYDYMDKGSNLAKAWMFHIAETLDIDWKSQYNVKDAKAFYVKYLGIDKTTFEKYALASSRMMEADANGKPKFKLECLDGISIGKLVILGKYFSEAGKSFNDEAEIENYALSMIESDFAKGTINLYMTDKKFEEAIKKSFEIIDVETKEVPADKPADNEKKPADNEKKPADNEKKPADSEKKPADSEKKPADNTPSKADKEGPTLKSMYEKLRSAMDVVEDTTTDERAKYKALLEAVKYSLDMLS